MIFSAGFSFGLDAATPLRTAALQVGLSPLFARLPSYVLIMGGGAIVNMIYCFTRLAFKKAANPEKSFETKLKSHHSAKVSRDSTVCSNSGSSTGP